MSPASLSYYDAANFSTVPDFSSAFCLYKQLKVAVGEKAFFIFRNLYPFFQPSAKVHRMHEFLKASSAILKALLDDGMNQILGKSHRSLFSLHPFAEFVLFSATNVVERTIFCPSKLQVSREKHLLVPFPCVTSCLSNTLTASVHECRRSCQVSAGSRGQKMCYFLTGPRGALKTRPWRRVPWEPGGGCITFNL